MVLMCTYNVLISVRIRLEILWAFLDFSDTADRWNGGESFRIRMLAFQLLLRLHTQLDNICV